MALGVVIAAAGGGPCLHDLYVAELLVDNFGSEWIFPQHFARAVRVNEVGGALVD